MRPRLTFALVLASALAAPAALAQPKPDKPAAGKPDPGKPGPGKPDPAKADPELTKAEKARLEAQKAEAERAAARLAELIKRGVEACERGEVEEGLSALSSAWSQKSDPEIAAQLGICEAKAGRFAAASDHLAAALRVKEDGPERKRLEEVFIGARKRVGVVKLAVDVEGADVLVGSRLVGLTPLPGDVFVDADVDTLIVIKKSGYDEAQRRVKVAAQRRIELKVQLGVTPLVGNDYGTPDRTKVPFFTLGGLALVAGGVGAAFYATAFTKGAAADSVLASLEKAYPKQKYACSPSHAGCDAVKDLRSGRDTFMNIGTGLFIGGGVLLGAAVLTGVWAFTAPSAARTSSITFTPAVSREGGSLLLQGAF